jgi:hypothetical protein
VQILVVRVSCAWRCDAHLDGVVVVALRVPRRGLVHGLVDLLHELHHLRTGKLPAREAAKSTIFDLGKKKTWKLR